MNGPISTAARHLIAAGVTGEALVEALAEIEAAAQQVAPAQPQRTARQERNRRYYQNRKGRGEASETRLNASEQDVSDEKVSPPHPLFQELPPAKKNPPTGVKKKAPPTAEPLLEVLDEERAHAVLDHRQKIRKPLTPHAAKLLAGKLAKCSDPNAAADLMIEKGWQSIEPEWFARQGNVLPIDGGGNRARDGTQDDDRWRKCLRYFDRHGEWDGAWGKPPGHPSCKVPTHILQEFRQKVASK